MARKKRILTLILIFFTLFWCTLAQAKGDKCKYDGPRPVGQVNMLNGGVYAPGQWGIILKTKYFKKDRIYAGNDQISKYTGKPQGVGVQKQERFLTKACFRYGVAPGMDLRLVVPYWQKDMVRGKKVAGVVNSYSSSNNGLGDLVFMGRYRLMSQKSGSSFNLALGGGVKMPTGDSDEEDNLADGCFGSGFQCGSGSWDPKLEIAMNQMRKNWRWDATCMYTLATEGDHDFEFGDKFQYNFGSSIAVGKHFDLQLEYNGCWQGKNTSKGDHVANSGGHLGYITPGFHIRFSRKPNVHLDFGLPILVYRDFNGEQLSEKYQFVCKLAVKF